MIDIKKINHTPAFVLEYELFQKNLSIVEQLQKELPVSFLFALKGFAMHAVFPELASVASGATASSLNEALLASPYFNEIHAYAPVYLKNEFEPHIVKEVAVLNWDFASMRCTRQSLLRCMIPVATGADWGYFPRIFHNSQRG